MARLRVDVGEPHGLFDADFLVGLGFDYGV